MNITREQQRTAIHDLLTPAWLRWTLVAAFTITLALIAAGALLGSPGAGRAGNMGMITTLLVCAYWLLRGLWLSLQTRRDPREVGFKLAAVALRRDGFDVRLRRERVALVGGPLDGDRIRLSLPKGAPWPPALCPTMGGVRQHYRLERAAGAVVVTYLYVGECAVGGVDE